MTKLAAECIWGIGILIILAVRIPREVRALSEPLKSGAAGFHATLAAALVFGIAVVPGLAVLTNVLQFADTPFIPALAWVGSAAAILGVWLFYRSHKDLGRHWSPTLEVRSEHRIVGTGVYARIRHPMYASLLIWGVAQTLLIANWIGGAGFLLGLFFFLPNRISREEQMLLHEFGDEYRAYMQRTQRLIPGIL